jgi:hypothetical protein
MNVPRTHRWIQRRSGGCRRLARRPATLAAVVLLALTAVAVPASGAAAASIDAECLGTFARTFSPAVTPISQTVTVTENSSYGTCAVGPTATGAETVTLPLSCISITTGPATIETLTWQDAPGATSTISWSPPTIVAQTVVFTGTVTAGRHTGDAATKVTSGVSFFASVVHCVLLGIPISSTTGLVDSLLLTH